MKEHPLSVRGTHLKSLSRFALHPTGLRPESGLCARRGAVVGASAIAAALVAVVPASAQEQEATEGTFTVQRFNPAPGPRNFITTRGVRSEGEMAWSGGFMANYGWKPFVVVSCLSPTNCDDPNAEDPEDVFVVENLVTADFMGSFTPIPALQVGLRIPVTWVKGQGMGADGSPVEGDLQAMGLGDAELEGKYRIFATPDDMIALGAGVFVTGPFGKMTAKPMGDACQEPDEDCPTYVGDETLTAGIRGIVDFSHGPFTGGANLIGVYRGKGRVGSTELGPEFRYGVAGGYRVSPLLRVVADGFGGTKFSAKNGTNTLEADVGAQIQPIDVPLVFMVGAGTGIIQGVGVPVLRAFLGVMYVHEPMDRDQDGFEDDVDECPTVAEDMDGHEDSDGCPEPDNDLDTILDEADKCPDQAEDPDGFNDTDGCPDLDNDKDGIPDDRDACPDKPETKNNYKDEDGCPDEADRDEDGVPDDRDKCPDGPEDTDGYEDLDGCPDPDNDGDGIPDNQDECLDEPETINEFEDEDGCPDEKPAEGAED